MNQSKLSVRRTKESDLGFVLEAEHASENVPFLVPSDWQGHLYALEDSDRFHGIFEVEGQSIGYIILAGLNDPNEAIEFRRVVITHKGRGLGRLAVRWAKAFAFETKTAHRLWLDVKTHNQRARHLYESEGFQVEGTLRECLRTSDGYESLIVLSILRSEWMAGKDDR